MLPTKRPSPKDSDDDLLRMQDEFIKQKSKPSALVTKGKGSSTTLISSNNKDKIAEFPSEKHCEFDERHQTNLVGDIIENICPERVPHAYDTMSQNPIRTSFPAVIHIDQQIKGETNKKSIFAQQMEKNRLKNGRPFLQNSRSGIAAGNNKQFIIHKNGLVDLLGSSEAQQIHEENSAKISQLSNEEIIENQKFILSHLDPKLVNFLRKNRSKMEEETQSSMNPRCSEICRWQTSDVSHSSIDTNKKLKSFPKILPQDNSSENTEILKKSKSYDRDGLILANISENEVYSPNDIGIESVDKSEKIVTVDLPEEELPIDPKAATKWIHMDKIENHKLQWMTLLPTPRPTDIKSRCTARFDFDGKLLSQDVNILTQEGLHHHGNEPELPGYSVEELFLLSRSSVVSQRIVGLQTLSRIMENNWQGLFDEVFEEPLLDNLLKSGLAPLLRWALDDNAECSVAAAVLAIHNLLVCKSDEICLDRTFTWAFGHISPFIRPYHMESEPEENLINLTDASIIKLDVVKGFLRMDLLPRFRYILQVLCPPLPVCEIIVETCIRIARHSHDSSKQIMECPFLMDIIFQKFLPVNFNILLDKKGDKDTSGYECPMYCCLKLMRVIASSSFNLASKLVMGYHLDKSILCYLSVNPCDSKNPAAAQKLIKESLKVWQVLLSYELCLNIYLDLLPLLIGQLHYLQSLSLNKGIEKSHDYEYASSLFKVLETVLIAAANYETNRPSSTSAPCVMWNHVACLIKITEVCAKRWLHEFSNGAVNTNGLFLLASCLDFTVTFYEKSQSQAKRMSSEVENIVESIFTKYLIPCVESSNFSTLLDRLRFHSVLVFTGSSGTKRDAQTLTSLGSILWTDDVIPIVKEETPFPIMISVLSFIISFLKTHPEFNSEVPKIILSCPYVLAYLKQLLCKFPHFEHWFNHFEINFVFRLSQLSLLSMCGDRKMWHEISLCILPDIKKSNDWIAAYLMENIIFNSSFFMMTYFPEEILCENRTINLVYNVISKCHPDLCSKFSSVGEKLEDNFENFILQNWEFNSNEFFIQKCPKKLLKICKTYIQSFLSKETFYQSKLKWEKPVVNNKTLTFEGGGLQKIIPYDWPYSPILMLYQKKKNRQKLPKNILPIFISYLEWIHFSLLLPAFKDIPPGVIFCHLNMIYCIDPDVCDDEVVKHHLQSLLCCLLSRNEKLDLENVQFGCISGYDGIFNDVLSEFEYQPLSHKNDSIANCILVTLQQCYPSRWKKLLFIERPEVLKFISISLTKPLIPVQKFLQPEESDPELLTEYFQAVSSGLLVPQRNPLFYLMAVHHLHHFIFTKTKQGANFRKMLLKSIMHSKKKEIIHDVLLYNEPNLLEPFGFSLKSSLSLEEKSDLQEIVGIPFLL